MKMKMQLNGFEVEVPEMHAFTTYGGLLCGIIDTSRNNTEEAEVKKRLSMYNTNQWNELYIPPIRKKRALSSITEDVRDLYDSENYPEERLDEYWLILELFCWDSHKKNDPFFSSCLYVAFNIKNLHLETIEEYLFQHLPIDTWNREAQCADF
jgi:hypothetical protein